eukprot:6935873-Prymnesium_polylepis.1
MTASQRDPFSRTHPYTWGPRTAPSGTADACRRRRSLCLARAASGKPVWCNSDGGLVGARKRHRGGV